MGIRKWASYVSLVFAVVLVTAALIHVLYRLWGGPLRVVAVVLVPAAMTVVVAWISSRKAREKPEPALESSPRVEPWRAESLQEEWNDWERKLDTYRWILTRICPRWFRAG